MDPRKLTYAQALQLHPTAQAQAVAGIDADTAASWANDLDFVAALHRASLSPTERTREIELAAVEVETGVTLARVVEMLARMAFFDPRLLADEDGNPVPLRELPAEVANLRPWKSIGLVIPRPLI